MPADSELTAHTVWCANVSGHQYLADVYSTQIRRHTLNLTMH